MEAYGGRIASTGMGQRASGARPVRPGEELDLIALRPWLDEHVPGLRGEPTVRQFAGGASNWTYLLQFENDDLILRRPPAGKKAKRAHDMGREYRIQKALKPVYPYVPEVRAYCPDESVLGAEFYVMERLDGVILRKNLPRDLTLSEAQVDRLCRNVLDTLVALHRVRPEEAGLSDIGKGAGYIQRQVDGWRRRYHDARTWNVPAANDVTTWLTQNLPRREHICLTHNDFRFDNVVLDKDDPIRVVGVLDWELATLGDPLMELGNTLAYWVEPGDDVFARASRRQPTDAARHDDAARSRRLLLRKDRFRPSRHDFLRGLWAVSFGRNRPADLLPLLSSPNAKPRLPNDMVLGQLPHMALPPTHEKARLT